MSSLRGEDSALIVREFNSITPENDLKIGPVHPTEDRYNFQNADAIIGFAQRNNLKVRDITLCGIMSRKPLNGSLKTKMATSFERTCIAKIERSHYDSGFTL
jgi:GH35 family endo-1,4-beta-xylanase